MKKYSNYKYSGVEWIRKIPNEWKTRKLKYYLDFSTGFTPPSGKKEYYANGKNIWITIADMKSKYIDDSKQYITDIAIKEFKANLTQKNALLYSFKLSIGKVAFASKNLYTNEAIISIENKKDLNLDFFYYALPLFIINNANENIYGAKILNQELIKNSFLLIPPKTEQQQIAHYLDKKTSKIDEIINDKEELIKLLEEKKEIIISNAVTKGLNPDIKIEYRKISHSFEDIGSGTTPLSGKEKYYNNGTIPWINTGDLNNDYIVKINKTITNQALEDYSILKMYPKNSLIIAMYGATIGKVGITKFDACVNQACCVLSKSDFYIIKYVYYWFLINKQNIIDMGYGGGQPNISQEIIKSLKIPYFEKQEQQQIVDYLDKKTDEINQTIQTIKDEIKLLKEYKEILIYEVVTGKIDVREEVVS